MALVLMKTFPAAFRSLITSSTSRPQLFTSSYRTFERFESRSITPQTSGIRVECYSSCSHHESWFSTSLQPSPRCYSSSSWNCYRLPGLFDIIRGKQSVAHIQPYRSLSLGVPVSKKRELVTIHFINRDGEKLTVKTSTGQNLLDVVIDNDLDIDGYGACEGTLSCSTCHLIFSEELFKSLPKPSDEELDMLDLAYGQTDTSRLGCQVVLRKDMDGMTFIVPDGVSDARDV